MTGTDDENYENTYDKMDELPVTAIVPAEKEIEASVLQQPNNSDDIAIVKVESARGLSGREFAAKAILLVVILLLLIYFTGKTDIMIGVIGGLAAVVVDKLLGLSRFLQEISKNT